MICALQKGTQPRGQWGCNVAQTPLTEHVSWRKRHLVLHTCPSPSHESTALCPLRGGSLLSTEIDTSRPCVFLILNSVIFFIIIYYCREAKFATPTCLIGMRINLGWLFLRNRDSGGLSFHAPLSCLKNLDKGPVPRIELSPDITCKGCGLWCGGGNSAGPRD